MPQKVHILATVREPHLLHAALLIFKTLRVGFPTADVHVWGNAIAEPMATIVRRRAEQEGCHFRNVPLTMHDRWIETIIYHEHEPCWICDTDVIFWRAVEHWFDGLTVELAGRYEPTFWEEWTDTMRVERLHTCLMYINPVALRVAIRAWTGKMPYPFGNTAEYPLIRQTVCPWLHGKSIFYDSTAGLWHAGIGTPFNPNEDDSFDHLHAATYVDLISPHLTGMADLAQCQLAIYENPELARGLRHKQNEWYASRVLPLTDARNEHIRERLQRFPTDAPTVGANGHAASRDADAESAASAGAEELARPVR